jgi:membrane dipeptidase
VVTLCHQSSHEWCDSSTDAPRHGGLTEEGIGIVREMARFGMVPDISHVSDDAALQTLAMAKGPVVASHSSARALCDHPRNLTDDLVREVARRGGLVAANVYVGFLDDEAARAHGARSKLIGPLAAEVETWDEDSLRRFGAARQEVLEAHPLPPVPLSVYVDHLIHLIELAGEEHVGVGTDFDGIDRAPEDLEDVSQMPNLTEALLARGVDKAGVRLILGGNFLRVLGEAERLAG